VPGLHIQIEDDISYSGDGKYLSVWCRRSGSLSGEQFGTKYLQKCRPTSRRVFPTFRVQGFSTPL